MIISVVSGKGGAGKTTLAASIAQVFSAEFYDLDVDAPNAEYFLQPKFSQTTPVTQPVPVFAEDLCDGCGICTKECRFHALYKILKTVYLTETLCHGCGLCEKVCPQQAISYQQASVGNIRTGYSQKIDNMVHIGDLTIGSTRGTYLIGEMVKKIDRQKLSVIDGPPGNSCAAVAALKPADLVVLVVEPTPFGFHDMQQTEQIVQQMGKNYLIIANKAMGSESVDQFFQGKSKQTALTIPLDDRYHKANLRGEILSQKFSEIHQGLHTAVSRELEKL
ncbi:MinD superfamily P-loop ATPase, contains an inserted ferredoxin domain [Desulfuromusa kysingii]|uniref:MinD superfamily P-loop ATPase, contains an inserted ferredoxin domain n=1 Tax=Desulfuromusa kysingii TaxID=37625 RepID=A0A1H3W8F9_9BACT|nr:4Fe-4S binding protein [Desulfuromusa kysingii]SDZ83419.1 MinD superfamily P-loop ATPase, contains an inserted ferredoxin domain [Desulfuromusa kysingii]